MKQNDRLDIDDLKKLCKDVYDNKPLFYGLATTSVLFGVIGTSILTAGTIGTIAGVTYKKLKENT